MTSELETVKNNDNGAQVYIVGAVAGITLGLVSAYFFMRVNSEIDSDKPRQIKTMDLLSLAVALIGIVRQVTNLGADR